MGMPTFQHLNVFTGKEWLLLAACYGIGCCTAGYYWVRWRTGLDLRFEGSGNVGAKNVGRIAGPSGFIVTLLIDGMKGALAVRLAMYLGGDADLTVACMLAVIIGHNWPIQLRFHGGKGIATSIGALLAYDSFIVLIVIGTFLPVFALLRNFTMSGLLAFALAPLVLFLYGSPNVDVAAISFIAMVVLISHRKNIREEFGRFFAPAKETPRDPPKKP
jgi:acyl phosphate:glycerol-3-phosphate acyltransferase